METLRIFCARPDCGARMPYQHKIVSVMAWLALLSFCQPMMADDVAEESKASASPSPIGLNGILPTEVPDDLSSEKFATLDQTWSDWSASAAARVKAFYTQSDLSLQEQRAAITALETDADVMYQALGDQRYQPIFDQLSGLHGSLTRRIGIASAIIDTLDVKAGNESRIEPARKELEKSLNQLGTYLTLVEHGDLWRRYVRVDEIAKVIRKPGNRKNSIPVLVAVQQKFKSKDRMEASQREFIGGDEFAAVEQSLNKYVLATKISIKKPATPEQLRPELQKLLNALEIYESNNSSVAAANARSAYEKVARMSADGGERIIGALREHYFNYNLRIVISEKFANRVFSTTQTSKGPVDDHVLGAHVTGTQTTEATVRLDFKPSTKRAQFDVVLQGVCQTQTQGVTSQAVITSQGYHRFLAAKSVGFDGSVFKMIPGTISVDANNTITGASTNVGLPIFRQIANDIAFNAAKKKRAQSEAIAARKLEKRLMPEFNAKVNQQFKDYNKALTENINERLRKTGLYPSAKEFVTTDEALQISTRLMSQSELAAGTPNSAVTSDEGCVIHIHESLFNNAFDRLQLAGRELTQDELVAEIEKSISELIDKPIQISKNDKEKKSDPAKLVMDTIDPVRIIIRDGLLILRIRTGLKPGGGKADIPTQRISVPLAIAIEGEQIVITRGLVSVAPVKPGGSRFLQIARAGVVRGKLQAAISDQQVDRNFSIKRKDRDDLKLAITDIKAVNGWLTIAIK